MMGDIFAELEDSLFSPLPDIAVISVGTTTTSSGDGNGDGDIGSARVISASSTTISVTPYYQVATEVEVAAAVVADTRSSKRRRTQDETQVSATGSEVFQWKSYSAPDTPSFSLCNQQKLFLIGEDYDLGVTIESSHFFAEENANNLFMSPSLVLYRQNQFRVTCSLQLATELTWTTPCVLAGDNIRTPVQMHASIYAIVEPHNSDARLGGSFEHVKISHVSRARNKKKEKSAVALTPFSNGKVDFSNLQFERSNVAKGPAVVDHYFRLVVDVIGKAQDGSPYLILSKISPRLVVRSHNPGSYSSSSSVHSHARNPSPPHQKSSPQQSLSSSSPQHLTPSPSQLTSTPSPLRTPSPHDFSYSPDNRGSSPQPSSFSPPQAFTPPQAPTFTPPQLFTVTETFSSSTQFTAQDFVSPQNFPPPSGSTPSELNSLPPITVLVGKVGINTATPQEALTVNGNILVTGDLYKPSDMRVKSHFMQVDNSDQLDTIRKLTIYDYLLRHRDRYERGVIAQEVQAILPAAVCPMGDVMMDDGKIVSNLLVVNERALLFENIGATKQLDKELLEAKETTSNINTRIDILEENTRNDSSYIKSKLEVLLEAVASEEEPNTKEDRPDAAVGSTDSSTNRKSSYAINDGIRIFDVGPARSLFILGFFLPALWFLGMTFIFSDVRSRRIGGALNVVMFVLYNASYFGDVAREPVINGICYFIGFGLVLFCGLVYKYKQFRCRKHCKKSVSRSSSSPNLFPVKERKEY